jgi:hypothetical protein
VVGCGVGLLLRRRAVGLGGRLGRQRLLGLLAIILALLLLLLLGVCVLGVLLLLLLLLLLLRQSLLGRLWGCGGRRLGVDGWWSVCGYSLLLVCRVGGVLAVRLLRLRLQLHGGCWLLAGVGGGGLRLRRGVGLLVLLGVRVGTCSSWLLRLLRLLQGVGIVWAERVVLLLGGVGTGRLLGRQGLREWRRRMGSLLLLKGLGLGRDGVAGQVLGLGRRSVAGLLLLLLLLWLALGRWVIGGRLGRLLQELLVLLVLVLLVRLLQVGGLGLGSCRLLLRRRRRSCCCVGRHGLVGGLLVLGAELRPLLAGPGPAGV